MDTIHGYWSVLGPRQIGIMAVALLMVVIGLAGLSGWVPSSAIFVVLLIGVGVLLAAEAVEALEK